MPASVALLQRKGVVYRPLSGVSPRVERALAWRADETARPALAFVEIVRELRRRLGWLRPRRG